MANVGILSPAAARTGDIKHFEDRLDANQGAVCNYVDRYLRGDNSQLDQYASELVNHVPPLDVIAVAGSSGVRAVADAQAGRANKIPIVQMVGGHPVPENSTFITGFHINAPMVATRQVRHLRDDHGITHIHVLLDYSSDTAAAVFNAIEREANAQLPALALTPLFARNPGELGRVAIQNPDPQRDGFMLAPSGMFFNDGNIATIIAFVETADVRAIYPERKYKDRHTQPHRNKVTVHGHDIKGTYTRAADHVDSVLRRPANTPVPQPANAEADGDSDYPFGQRGKTKKQVIAKAIKTFAIERGETASLNPGLDHRE
jgi:hypothetical protein